MTGQNSAVQIKHELAAIRNYLIAAQDVMKTGHMPDLTGLENRVAILCEAIQTAEPDAQKECLPELMVLLDQLNSCATDIRASPPGMPQGGRP